MRKTLAALTLALSFLPAITQAQLRMALIGGPQKATVEETNSIAGWEQTIKPGYKARNGFHIGALAEVPLSSKGRWVFHPGLIYSTKGREYFNQNSEAVAQQTDTISVNSRFYTNYIDVPLNVGYKFRLGVKSNFLITAGPYMAFFYSGKTLTETRLVSSDKLHSDEGKLEVGNQSGKVGTLDLGINGRAGLEIGSVLITAFYSKGLKDFYKAGYDGSFRHQVVGASLGFWLNQSTTTKPAPKDRDNDGVLDKDDACPTVPGPMLTHGCPDKDGDGVADIRDNCPEVPGVASRKGCPILDNDKDGIENDQDKCPDIAGTIAYHGCPVPDTDGDGINDEQDECKEVPGVARYKGCPVPDTDHDGVNDLDDKCPDLPGIASNNGCPEIKKEVIQQVNYTADKIFFFTNSDKLSASSFRALDKLAILLQHDQSLKLNIAGHTDNIGTVQTNQVLSEKRASAVSNYLISRGVPASRIQTEGFGASRPIESNDTAAGREKNRRVELSVSNN